MPAPITVLDLKDQVEDQIDDSSEVDVSAPDILQALNRAQDFAADILARHYPDPLLQPPITIPLVGGQIAYTMPEDLFEQRVKAVEVTSSNNMIWPMTRIAYSDVYLYEAPSTTPIPQFYSIVGNEIYVVPPPSGIYPMRVWSMREPESLVYPQGRVTVVDIPNNTIVVDNIGEDLDTSSDQLDSYVNLVDGQTGLVKASLQIMTLDDNQIKFKTVPTRSTVMNKDILGAIPITINADDYVCSVRGTCVPYLKKPYTNFMIQYAVVEIKRRLGEDTQAEASALKDFEEQIKHQWVGRQNQLRVQKRSEHWYRPFRRFWRS